MTLKDHMHHVVLADDDADHGLLFERVLHQLYPKVVISFVGDGEQLLPFLRRHAVDLLFLDLKMPCKNGLECLREIRREPSLQSLPVVAYSSSAHPSDMEHSFHCGSNLYLVKPFSTEHLKTAFDFIFSIDWKGAAPPRLYFMNNRFVPYTAIA